MAAEVVDGGAVEDPASPARASAEQPEGAVSPAAASRKAEEPMSPEVPAVSAFARAAEASLPGATFTGEGPAASGLLTDVALVVLYLRRLGFEEDEAANHAANKPLKAGASGCKALLTDLVQRHMLRVPFENLGPQQPSMGTKACAERIAGTIGGGTGIVINAAFVWLLRQLGARARLALASAAAPACAASHVTILVELAEGMHLADPGFSDPPRTAVRLEGETTDDLAAYKVGSSGSSGAPDGFDMVLMRSRGTGSLSRHAWHPDSCELDKEEEDMTEVYAFRQSDDLGEEELQSALQASRAASGRLYTEQRLVLLALPKGHVSLSEQKLRKVEGGAVVSEESMPDEAAWRLKVSEVLTSPLVSRPGKMGRPLPPKSRGSKFQPVDRKNSLNMDRQNSLNTLSRGAPTGTLKGVQASRYAAEAASKGLGLVDSRSLAVGGAGAGGGLGLNAPGFGNRVQHFSGGGSGGGAKSIQVKDEIHEAWQRVMDDNSPLGWVYCEYATDGKALELTESGDGGLQEFKEKLGSTIAWGGFRCAGVDRRGGVECKRPKFVFVQYKPEAASAMKKAKAASHKGDVKEIICGAHIDVTVESLKDLDEQALISKLQAATGAHKPNGYEFQDGVFLEADFYGLGIGKECKGETSKN